MIKLGCLVDQAIRQRCRDHTDLVDIQEFIHFAHELRLDVIDFHLFNMPLDRDYLTSLKTLCLKLGMPIGYVGRGGGLWGPVEPRRVTVESAKLEVDAASLMGAPMARFRIGSSTPGRTPDGELAEEHWPKLVGDLQQVCDYAAEKAVVVGVQNHDSGGALSTADDMLRLLNDVDRDNFNLIMDAGQWMGSPGGNPIGEIDPDVDFYEYMERVAPHASTVRAKIYKIDSGREEWIDYERVVKILRSVNFNGNISMVFELDGSDTSDTPEAVRLAVSHLRELLAAN